MAPQKETFMLLTVDLECDRCYTKVNRILGQFPQIRDQIYREKENKVLIKVVCCSPEKIRDKLGVKGGKSIKSVQILEPKKPPAPLADTRQKKKVTFKLDEQPAKPQGDGAAKPKEAPSAAAAPKPTEQAAMMAPMVPTSVYGYGYPVNVGCLDCYEGRMCYHSNGSGYGYGYGVPPPPPPAGCYGVPPPPPPAYGYKPDYYVNRYGDYVSDENASGCVVM